MRMIISINIYEGRFNGNGQHELQRYRITTGGGFLPNLPRCSHQIGWILRYRPKTVETLPTLRLRRFGTRFNLRKYHCRDAGQSGPTPYRSSRRERPAALVRIAAISGAVLSMPVVLTLIPAARRVAIGGRARRLWRSVNRAMASLQAGYAWLLRRMLGLWWIKGGDCFPAQSRTAGSG